MPKLKVQLHTHTKQDPRDKVQYTEIQLIDHAAKLGYDAISITCHNVLIFNEQLAKYAKSKGVILIPGIEKEIEDKRVLIINATLEAQYIKNFKDLKKYRKKNSNSLIVAPHPYHWRSYSLRSRLIENIELFDGIEENYYYCKQLNFGNSKARQVAKQFNIPLVGASDTHILKYMDSTYSLVESAKNTNSIIQAIKDNKIEVVSQDLKIQEIFKISLNLGLKNLARKALLLQ